MKYFIVEVSEQFIAPVPIGWYGLIDKKTLSRKSPYQMAKHLLFSVESNMQMIFTDVLTSPCFMVSETIRNVVRKYDTVPYTLGEDNDKCGKPYFGVDKKSIEEKAVVEITDGHNSHVIMRMDLVESILRRQAVGIGLREIQII